MFNLIIKNPHQMAKKLKLTQMKLLYFQKNNINPASQVQFNKKFKMPPMVDLYQV
jgi:hypothetical protein